MSDWNKLILGEEDSQTAPVCNGTVREMIAEIERLKGELEEAKDESFKREARIMMYVNKNSDIKRQLDTSQSLLAEVKVENERLNELHDEATHDYFCDMNKRLAEAHQEVARTILQIISMETVDRPFEQSQAVEIIRQRYKLEG